MASVSGSESWNRDPAPARGFHGDPSAQRLDVALHHIHADAAAGDVGNHVNGREARQENQLIDFIVVQRGVGRHQAAVARLGQHLFPRDAASVVGHFDDDAAAAMFGAQVDRALARLAAGLALVRRLDAVVERVAQQVGQRVGELFDDGLVDFGAFAADDQADVLAELGGNLPHQSRHAGEHGFHRLGADCHDAFLQFPQMLGHGVQAVQQAGAHFRRQLAAKLRQHGLIDDEFADQVDQLVHFLDIDADRRAGGRRAVPGRRLACRCVVATAG